MEDAALGAAPRRELTQTIFEEAERLNRLVGNLLDMTRLEAAQVELKREWHSLEEVVGGAVARIEKRLGGRHLSTAIPEDLPLIPVDGLLIQQLLVNLLENAARYTPSTASLRLAATARPGESRSCSRTTAPACRRERKSGCSRSSTGPRPGTTGSAWASRSRAPIVEAHGGRIQAENRAPHGALFRVTLPIVGTPPAGREAEDDDGRD